MAALVLLSGCCPGRTPLSPSVSDSLQVEREVRYVEKLWIRSFDEVPVESRMVGGRQLLPRNLWQPRRPVSLPTVISPYP
ncbi:MAG: hypothetical protein ACLUZZ_00155 [Alistipes inops]